MNIAFVGLAGVPYLSRACDIRLMSFAHAFVKAGNQVVIFNRFPVRKKSDLKPAQSFGLHISVIELIKRNPSKNKLVALIISLLSYPIEFFKIVAYHRKNKIDFLQVYSGHFFEFLFYRLLAKTIGAKTIYQYVEFRSEISRTGIYHKLNGILCDRYGHQCFDGILSISNFIEAYIRQQSPSKPIVKVPPIGDFDYFDTVPDFPFPQNYLLFCASIDYAPVIQMVIDAYLLTHCQEQQIGLRLVISGNPGQLAKIEQSIQGNKNIQLYSNLPYDTLISYYKSAFALLIPLRDSIQDKARFPNKICEYAAAKNIIITTRFGEIPFYFKDRENALVADEYSAKAIAEKINWLLINQHQRDEIRNKAYQTGKKYFNIDPYVGELHAFMDAISTKKEKGRRHEGTTVRGDESAKMRV